MPGSWLFQYSLWKGRSVPSSCVTLNCSAVSCFWRSAFDGRTYFFADAVATAPGAPTTAVVLAPLAPVVGAGAPPGGGIVAAACSTCALGGFAGPPAVGSGRSQPRLPSVDIAVAAESPTAIHEMLQEP